MAYAILKNWLEHDRLTRKWIDQKRMAQEIKEQKKEQRRIQTREVKEWSEERQAEAALNAYEASIIIFRMVKEHLKEDGVMPSIIMMIRQEEQLFT